MEGRRSTEPRESPPLLQRASVRSVAEAPDAVGRFVQDEEVEKDQAENEKVGVVCSAHQIPTALGGNLHRGDELQSRGQVRGLGNLSAN